MNVVLVMPPDPAWEEAFVCESARIRASLSGLDMWFEHIGSTAIRGIFAKPIIDMLLVVRDVQALDERTPAMTSLGYEAMGEFGIAGRRYFRRTTAAGVRTHHVHAFGRDSADVRRHVAFRDYMNAHPAAAQAYSNLKQSLAREHPHDMDAYIDGKNAFIKHHEALALAWYQRSSISPESRS